VRGALNANKNPVSPIAGADRRQPQDRARIERREIKGRRCRTFAGDTCDERFLTAVVEKALTASGMKETPASTGSPNHCT
jgi:hypothetical protein